VGEVRIYLADHPSLVGQSLREPDRIGTTQPFFGRPVQDCNEVMRCSQRVCEVPGPVRRTIINNEDSVTMAQNGPDQRLEILAFVVGRYDDSHLIGAHPEPAPPR
jgi:hypothetical protein